MKPCNFPERKRQRQIAAYMRFVAFALSVGSIEKANEAENLNNNIPTESLRNVRTKKRRGDASRGGKKES